MALNKYYIASLLWAVLILVLTLTPGKSMPNSALFSYDKVGHIGIFFVQAYFFVSGIYFNTKDVTKSILWGLLIAISYGMLIEVGQEYIPDRGMEIGDLLANCLGSLMGIGLFYLSYKLNWQ